MSVADDSTKVLGFGLVLVLVALIIAAVLSVPEIGKKVSAWLGSLGRNFSDVAQNAGSTAGAAATKAITGTVGGAFTAASNAIDSAVNSAIDYVGGGSNNELAQLTSETSYLDKQGNWNTKQTYSDGTTTVLTDFGPQNGGGVGVTGDW